jgi:hypothetical protein
MTEGEFLCTTRRVATCGAYGGDNGSTAVEVLMF